MRVNSLEVFRDCCGVALFMDGSTGSCDQDRRF